MKSAFLYSLGCILALLVQAGFMSSLPDPWRLFPFLLLCGIIILHERSLWLGALWIVAGGLILEGRGLGPGLAFASIVAAGSAVFLATTVFAKRSWFALVGVALGTTLAYLVARLIFLTVLNVVTPAQYDVGQFIGQGITTMLLAFVGIVFLGTYVRRLTQWSRVWFVRRPAPYETTTLT